MLGKKLIKNIRHKLGGPKAKIKTINKNKEKIKIIRNKIDKLNLNPNDFKSTDKISKLQQQEKILKEEIVKILKMEKKLELKDNKIQLKQPSTENVVPQPIEQPIEQLAPEPQVQQSQQPVEPEYSPLPQPVPMLPPQQMGMTPEQVTAQQELLRKMGHLPQMPEEFNEPEVHIPQQEVPLQPQQPTQQVAQINLTFKDGTEMPVQVDVNDYQQLVVDIEQALQTGAPLRIGEKVINAHNILYYE